MKKKIFYLGLVFIILTFTLINCKKSTVDTSPKGLSRLSGLWSGNAEVKTSSATCNAQSPRGVTRQLWTVDDNGNVTILDTTTFSPTEIKIVTWIGKIDMNNQINVYTTWDRVASCGGPLQLNFRDKLILTTNSSIVKDTVDFPICPPNCLWQMQYSLVRQ